MIECDSIPRLDKGLIGFLKQEGGILTFYSMPK
jgi:hypothetical protein